MKLYARIASSHFGSSALFGSFFLASTWMSDGLTEALTVSALAAASWFATFPGLKRLTGAVHGG